MKTAKVDVEIFEELRKVGKAQEAKLKKENQASKEIIWELETQIKKNDEIITNKRA